MSLHEAPNTNGTRADKGQEVGMGWGFGGEEWMSVCRGWEAGARRGGSREVGRDGIMGRWEG